MMRLRAKGASGYSRDGGGVPLRFVYTQKHIEIIGVHMISQWRGLHWWIQEYGLARAEHEHITGVWQSPQRDPGAEPLVRGSGRSPLKLQELS